MDEEHQKHILTTGFNHFWRGRRQKERMWVFPGFSGFSSPHAYTGRPFLEMAFSTAMMRYALPLVRCGCVLIQAVLTGMEEGTLTSHAWAAYGAYSPAKHRALARPFFAKDRISDFELFEKYSSLTLAILHIASSTGTPVDAQDLYARFSLDAASEFLFGERLDTLHGSLPVAGEAKLGTKGTATDDAFGAFVKAFEASQSIITTRAIRGYFWPIRELLRDEAEPHAEIISKFLEPIVQRALDRKKKMRQAGVTPSTEHDTFLDYLTDNTEGRCYQLLI